MNSYWFIEDNSWRESLLTDKVNKNLKERSAKWMNEDWKNQLLLVDINKNLEDLSVTIKGYFQWLFFIFLCSVHVRVHIRITLWSQSQLKMFASTWLWLWKCLILYQHLYICPVRDINYVRVILWILTPPM